MNIDDLTYGELKKIANLFNKTSNEASGRSENFIGEKVIIRTYTAGVFYGELSEKSGSEVIIKNARRLYYWKTADKGVSLSEVAISGLHNDSKVCAPVTQIWLQAIEIIPCSKVAIKSIEGKNEYKA